LAGFFAVVDVVAFGALDVVGSALVLVAPGAPCFDDELHATVHSATTTATVNTRRPCRHVPAAALPPCMRARVRAYRSPFGRGDSQIAFHETHMKGRQQDDE
jgi:hypothetical protein